MPGTPVALANDDSGADHERSTVAQATWTSMVVIAHGVGKKSLARRLEI
jgi:hypothetical protein